MSKRHFSGLLLVTIVVAAMVLLIPGKTAKESAFVKQPLLPGLVTAVNDIEYIRLTGAAGETIATLNRRGGKWLLMESSQYPVDWVVLRQLLSDLAAAEVIEEKTSNPELYSRLGVEDITAPDAAGVLIVFAEETGLPSLIVGNQAQGREGQYVRLEGSDQSVLIGRALTVPKETQQWLDLDIIDVPAGEVVEVSIIHPEGEQVHLVKASADDADFELQNIPEGREIQSNWSVNSIGGSMASLRMDSVTPDKDIDWSDAVETRLLTADGLQVTVKVVSAQEQHWISLHAGVYQPAGSGESAGPDEAAEASGPAERAKQINERVSGWAYAIPQYKSETMTKRMEDLLQAAESD